MRGRQHTDPPLKHGFSPKIRNAGMHTVMGWLAVRQGSARLTVPISAAHSMPPLPDKAG